MLDHRVERAVGVVGRAAGEPDRAVARRALAQSSGSGGTCRSRARRRAAPPGPRPPWPAPSGRAGAPAPARARPAAAVARPVRASKRPSAAPLADDARQAAHRLGEALEATRAEIAAARTAPPSSRRVASAITTCPGSAERLQPGGEVGRLADHRLLCAAPSPDQIADHDEAGGDADPRGQRLAVAASACRPPPPTIGERRRARPARPRPHAPAGQPK